MLSIEPNGQFGGSGLGLLLRPYVQYLDGLIWATPGLYFLSEDYVLLNKLGNNMTI